MEASSFSKIHLHTKKQYRCRICNRLTVHSRFPTGYYGRDAGVTLTHARDFPVMTTQYPQTGMFQSQANTAAFHYYCQAPAQGESALSGHAGYFVQTGAGQFRLLPAGTGAEVSAGNPGTFNTS